MSKKMMREDDDIENMGIMQGFMDSMGDEGDDEDEGENPEMMMERRPNSPEILMNNLRGDMRSIDARRDELADLVGYQAATETPEQVLAMLQPILAQQGGGGIGALPQSQDMAQGPQPPMMGGAPGMPPPGMPPMPPAPGAPPPDQGGIAALMAGMGGGAPPGPPGAPPGMPPGMPPTDMPPMAMARGGYVQNFQVGSSPAGVTPTTEDDSESNEELLAYPPELVSQARAQMQSLLGQRPAPVPTLAAGMKTRLPEYQALLGEDKGRGNAEAQLLFELGQRAFNFGANTDDSGRPLRGGFFGRLAGAAKSLPGAIGKHVEAMNSIDLKLKSLALQASEKDQDQVVAQNTKLLDTKSRVFGDILKASAKAEAAKMKGVGTSIFGKGDWQWNVVNMPGLIESYAAGTTTPAEDKLVSSAITVFKTPRFETRFDPVTREPYTVQMPVMIPDFVKQAEAARMKSGKPSAPTPALVPAGNPARVEAPQPVASPVEAPQPSAPPVAAQEPAQGPAVSSPVNAPTPLAASLPVPTPVAAPAPTPLAAPAPTPMAAPAPTPMAAPVPTPVAAPAPVTTPSVRVPAAAPQRLSLWSDRFKVAGPVAAAIGSVSSIPGLGDPAAAVTLARQRAELDAERLIEAMLKSTQGSVTEQKRLEGVINIRPSAWSDPDVYGTRLIALGLALQSGIKEFNAQGADNSGLAPEAKGKARTKAMEYKKFYSELGLPPAVYSEAEYRKYPPGTEVLWQGKTPAKVSARSK